MTLTVEANGARIPAIGHGTWTLRGDAAIRAVRSALEAGYRHIDTAAMYGNEAEVGEALRSQMTPRERFDRLFNRVMTAAEEGDTATVVNFTPMALGAYAQLDTVNVDARYHAAVLNAQVGDFAAARTLADTILMDVPGHLFGHVIRGEVARIENDEATLARAHREFLESYDAEMAANRVEYLEHRPVLERFRTEAGGR